MRLEYSARLLESLAEAPTSVQKAFYKQVRLLEQNIRHPSLKAKKYNESKDIWQARVTLSWRFYFRISGDMYYLLDVIKHPK